MPEILFKPRKGKTLRFTRLVDDCCSLPAEDTEDSIIVIDVFTVVSIAPNVEEGAATLERKANGDICTYDRELSILQDATVNLTLCQVSASTVCLLTGATEVLDADDNVVGFDILEGANENRTLMEIWSGAAGVDCGEGAKYGYLPIPCTYDWQITDTLEIGGADSLFTVTLVGRTNSNHDYGQGPFAVQLSDGGTPGPLITPIASGVHARVMVTDVPPPAVTNGWVAASAANGYLYGPDSI